MAKFKVISKKPVDLYYPLKTEQTECFPNEIIEVEDAGDIRRLHASDKFEFIPEVVEEEKVEVKKEKITPKVSV